MYANLMTLDKIPLKRTACIIKLTSFGITKRRMLDLGLIPGTKIYSLIKSPSGDPTAYEIRGAVMALRYEETCKIVVKLI